jgi:hypothetical protein
MVERKLQKVVIYFKPANEAEARIVRSFKIICADQGWKHRDVILKIVNDFVLDNKLIMNKQRFIIKDMKQLKKLMD